VAQGSAAFRCIACDRVLPDNNTWNPPPQRPSAGRKAHTVSSDL